MSELEETIDRFNPDAVLLNHPTKASPILRKRGIPFASLGLKMNARGGGQRNCPHASGARRWLSGISMASSAMLSGAYLSVERRSRSTRFGSMGRVSAKLSITVQLSFEPCRLLLEERRIHSPKGATVSCEHERYKCNQRRIFLKMMQRRHPAYQLLANAGPLELRGLRRCLV